MVEPVKVLLLFVNEADVWKDVPLYYAIVQRLLHDAGGFQYNDENPALVVGALQSATKKSALEFAEEALFEPLGFEGYEWMHQDPTGIDNEAKLRAAIPDVREMMTEGLTLLLDAELVLDLPQSV